MLILENKVVVCLNIIIWSIKILSNCIKELNKGYLFDKDVNIWKIDWKKVFYYKWSLVCCKGKNYY